MDTEQAIQELLVQRQAVLDSAKNNPDAPTMDVVNAQLADLDAYLAELRALIN
jgi:recombinational DNA repair ATPase RecF